MTRYIVWHTARSGSNMLMSMLAGTKVAGIADYENCGFYVGLKHHSDIALMWDKRVESYFDKQRTSNGIEGCKGNMIYFDEMRPLVSNDKVDVLLSSFTHHIYLHRLDIVAQAVSCYVAEKSKIWSTLQEDKGIQPHTVAEYDFDRIQGFVEKTEYESNLINDWFDTQGIEPYVVAYEDMVKNPVQTIAHIMQFLGIVDLYEWQAPYIRKQHNPLKTQFVSRYHEDTKTHVD